MEFQCEECEYEVSMKKNLRKHIRGYHENVAISEAEFELGNI